MKAKWNELWNGTGRWILIGLPLAALIIGIAVWRASTAFAPPRQTIAEPPAEQEVTFDLEKNRSYTSDDGVVVIQTAGAMTAEETAERTGSAVTVPDPEHIWTDAIPLSTENYTLPDEAALADGSIGLLSIPKLDLSANVFETESEIESMTKGIAHFKNTSAWSGNIGLCSHNVAPKGAAAFFRDLHLLSVGDKLTYTTAMGERGYKVTEIREIAGDDWSYLSRTEDNRITMITCITGKPKMRLMVQAVQG